MKELRRYLIDLGYKNVLSSNYSIWYEKEHEDYTNHIKITKYHMFYKVWTTINMGDSISNSKHKVSSVCEVKEIIEQRLR